MSEGNKSHATNVLAMVARHFPKHRPEEIEKASDLLLAYDTDKSAWVDPFGITPANEAAIERDVRLKAVISALREAERQLLELDREYVLYLHIVSRTVLPRLHADIRTIVEKLSVRALDEAGLQALRPPRGRPKKTGVFALAIACAYTYCGLSKQKPTIRVDPLTNRAYGPFLEFVSDAFDLFGIDASSETWARKAADLPEFKE